MDESVSGDQEDNESIETDLKSLVQTPQGSSRNSNDIPQEWIQTVKQLKNDMAALKKDILVVKDELKTKK